MRAQRDPDEGPMVVFGDDDQELSGRGALGLPALEVSLTQNVRTTGQIAAVPGVLTQEPQQCRGADGPEPVFLDCAADSVVGVADGAVAALQEKGQYRPGDIALLTTQRRHPEHIDGSSDLGRWRSRSRCCPTRSQSAR